MFHRAKILLAAACLLAAPSAARAAAPSPSIVATSTGSVNVSWTGGTSPFIAVISTSPSFLVFSASGSVTASATSYPFLDPDTTYYFKVKSSGDIGQYSSILSTVTPVAAPSGIYTLSTYFTSDSSYTATARVGWNAGGNPEWTAYDLQYADNAGFSPSVTVPKGYPPVTLGGLDANTTYYFKVRARGVLGTTTPYTPFISTATMAMRLTGVSDSVFETTAAVAWTPLDDGAVQALSSKGYTLLYSPNSSLTPAASWTTGINTTASHDLAGLARNTTYYYQVGALNHPGMPNMTETRTFTTLSARPLGLTRLSVLDGSASLGWIQVPAADAMGYRLEASTSNFSGGAVESSSSYRTDLSTLTIVTLYPNTTYYFRTAGLNSAFVPNYGAVLSSVTLALPVSADLAYPSAEPHQITVRFNSLQAAPQPFACEGYSLEASTAAFGAGGTVFSSVTYTFQDGLRPLTVSGLAANTTYFMRLGTLNWERTPNYTLLASTKTGFPGPLTGVTLNSVWSSSASLNYVPDPQAEAHVAEASTYRFFTSAVLSSATPNAALTSLVVPGLLPNTSYYFRVGALYNGTTIYSNAVPALRWTLPRPLTGLDAPAVYQSSITVSWTALSGATQDDTAETYVLQAATGPAFTPVLASSVTGNVNLDRLTITGLSPNTSYYFRAGTVNYEGSVNYTATPATATMANPPSENGFNLTSLTLTPKWLTNSNPPDTRYLAELSRNENFTPVQASSLTVLSSATFSGLIPNTTYYSRLYSINRLNRYTPAVIFSSMATGAYDPVAAPASGTGISSVTLNWGRGSNPALVTWYQAQVSSSSDFTGTVLSSVTLNLSSTFYGLVSDASYYLRVSALNLSSLPTDPPVQLGNVLTLPATAYILPKEQTFSGMLTDGFSVSWDPNGNSSHTVYYVQASTLADFSVINSSRLVNALTCSFSDLLIDTDYWVRVQARGQSGVQTVYEEAGSTRTLLSRQNNAAALQANEITLDTSYGEISVLLPLGSIGISTKLTLMPSTVTLPSPNSAVSQLSPTGIGVSLGVSPQTLVRGALTVTLPYRLSDLPPGTDRSRLVLAVYNGDHSIWVPLSSVSDTANNRVVGLTWNLPVSEIVGQAPQPSVYYTKFQIMQAAPAAGLAAVKIYPNPYRPNSVSDVMHFSNMTPNARVKIYTFLGELVRSLKADVNGMAHWDGRNDAGNKAASGVYIAFIQTKDKAEGKSFKVALER